MGQAKNRGTYEQRIAQAKEREALEQQALAERLEAARKAQIDAAVTAHVTGIPRPRGKSRLALLAALALASAVQK